VRCAYNSGYIVEAISLIVTFSFAVAASKWHTARHEGHFFCDLFKLLYKQTRQKVCPHGQLMGSFNKDKQHGHSSAFITCCEVPAVPAPSSPVKADIFPHFLSKHFDLARLNTNMQRGDVEKKKTRLQKRFFFLACLTRVIAESRKKKKGRQIFV